MGGHWPEHMDFRIAVSMTPPAGDHKGKKKETLYTYNGQDVLIYWGGMFTFIIMKSQASGKDQLFRPTESKADDDQGFDLTTTWTRRKKMMLSTKTPGTATWCLLLRRCCFGDV